MSAALLFAWPQALPVLGAVPVVALVLVALEIRRRRRLAALVGPRHGVLADQAGPGWPGPWLTASGLLLALVALLQPLGGEDPRAAEQRGVDVVVCLDVSRSMLARDVAPSRLEAARREIRALADRVRGDRLALVAFAGEARLVVPLTRDMGSFASLVDAVDPLAVSRGGTDLGAALASALGALGSASGDHEAVVLVTDGEDHGQRGLAAAAIAKQRGVAVHCVGLGSPRGSKIPLEGEGSETYLRDAQGRDVVSALDVEGLRAIAAATGGDFVEAVARPLPLVGLYERRILAMARKVLESGQRLSRHNHYQWPLLGALVLWLAGLCLGGRRSLSAAASRSPGR